MGQYRQLPQLYTLWNNKQAHKIFQPWNQKQRNVYNTHHNSNHSELTNIHSDVALLYLPLNTIINARYLLSKEIKMSA